MTTKPISRFKAATTLTLSGGAISIVQGVHVVAAEAGVTDDLDTINNGIFNMELFLMADSGDTITIKDGTGNIETGDGNDVDLDGDKVAHLLYDVGNTVWKVVAVSATGGSSSGTSASNVLESHTASNSATLEFDVSSYSSPLEFILESIVPATDGADLTIEVSDDNGSTWESTNYVWSLNLTASNRDPASDSNASSSESGTTSAIVLTASVGVGSASGEALFGTVEMDNPSSSIYKIFTFDVAYTGTSAQNFKSDGSGSWQGSTNAITNVRFLFDSGNIESGTIKMIDPTIAQAGSPSLYEDDEVRIPGEWWQDPNNTSDYYPKYRKVVSLGSLPNASTATTAHGITNYHLDSMRIYGHCDNGTKILPLPQANDTATATIRLNIDGANIVVDSGGEDRSSYTGYAVLEYAKTTDTPVTRAQAYGNAATSAALDVPQTFTAGQRGEVTALTDGANISIDLDDSNNFSVTLGGNRQLDNPSNAVAGQSGRILVTQDATGSRTLSYDTYYVFAGGTAPTLTTDANAVDMLVYEVISATEILLQLVADIQ